MKKLIYILAIIGLVFTLPEVYAEEGTILRVNPSSLDILIDDATTFEVKVLNTADYTNVFNLEIEEDNEFIKLLGRNNYEITLQAHESRDVTFNVYASNDTHTDTFDIILKHNGTEIDYYSYLFKTIWEEGAEPQDNGEFLAENNISLIEEQLKEVRDILNLTESAESEYAQLLSAIDSKLNSFQQENDKKIDDLDTKITLAQAQDNDKTDYTPYIMIGAFLLVFGFIIFNDRGKKSLPFIKKKEKPIEPKKVPIIPLKQIEEKNISLEGSNFKPSKDIFTEENYISFRARRLKEMKEELGEEYDYNKALDKIKEEWNERKPQRG